MMLCVLLFCLAAAIAAPAQSVSFTSLYSFCWRHACPGGYAPYSQLLQATDGNFYGTTSMGGFFGGGTVFKITPAEEVTTFYNFCSQAGQFGCGDGGVPHANVIQGTDGNFYGTNTSGGGANQGTIFKITPEGTLTVLQSFGGLYGFSYDGDTFAELVQGTDGNFYGTTANGGSDNCPTGCGTIFRITPNGTMTTLYNFCTSSPCYDGFNPAAGLVQGSDGNFYGTTAGWFTVFEITPGGVLTTLYSGSYESPLAALVQGTNGNFYGTTSKGGANDSGSVFEITPSGTLTTLYSFCVAGLPCTDGLYPHGALVQGTDGNFYGTTSAGGGGGAGTVFRITPSGTLTTLHSFDGSDGATPYAGLLQASNGTFYGTTYLGGSDNVGTLFLVDVVHTCATCRP